MSTTALPALTAVRGGGEPGPGRPLALLLHGDGSSEHDLPGLAALQRAGPDRFRAAVVLAGFVLAGEG